MATKLKEIIETPESVKELPKFAMPSCTNCTFYRETFGMCCRFPQSVRKALHEWCGEYAK